MWNYSRHTRRVGFAICGLLVVSGAVVFAQHHSTFTQAFLSPARAALTATRSSPLQNASTRPVVKMFLSGAVERDGKRISIEAAGPVRPGEVVSFTLDSVNEGSAPAREYRAIGRVPEGTAFVGDSARGDGKTLVTYSIDGGKEFSVKPLIDEPQPDGTTKKVAAPISMYTQVRFEWADSIAPGGKVVASYQVRVK